ILWVRCRRNRRAGRRHAAARHRSEARLGAPPPRSLPARCRQRQPGGIAARARLRHQGGRPHHCHPPPHLHSPGRSGAAEHSESQGVALHRAQRSPPVAARPGSGAFGGTLQAEGETAWIWLLMHLITLDSETDFDGWRKAARALALNQVPPSEVTWTVRGNEPELFAEILDATAFEATSGTFNVPAKFVELAQAAILHRDSERFALLYRLLWRLRSDHDLLDVATDPDVAKITAMAKAVHGDEHKMHAFVRFRGGGRDREPHYVPWFEPEHHIVELASPFFAGRFADMPWSILTP